MTITFKITSFESNIIAVSFKIKLQIYFKSNVITLPTHLLSDHKWYPQNGIDLMIKAYKNKPIIDLLIILDPSVQGAWHCISFYWWSISEMPTPLRTDLNILFAFEMIAWPHWLFVKCEKYGQM